MSQEVREAFLTQDALQSVVTLVAEPLSNHPEMSERVRPQSMMYETCAVAAISKAIRIVSGYPVPYQVQSVAGLLCYVCCQKTIVPLAAHHRPDDASASLSDCARYARRTR